MEPVDTPKSSKISKKQLHLKTLNQLIPFSLQNCQTFVLGISGGDCAGKRQMIQYMFQKRQDGYVIRGTQEPVTVVHQSYFRKSVDGSKYTSAGTDWQLFSRQVVSLLVGNTITVNVKKNEEVIVQKLTPAKLLVVQGSHIFMDPTITFNVSRMINLKIFIDSDSDVRLSRRVYQDTQQLNIDSTTSVNNYLQFIKPSYQRQIQPTKQKSDIIIPHFGGGFNDHKKQETQQYSSNIVNACSLIMARLREQMKKYTQVISQ